MKLKKAKEVLEAIESEMSLLTNHTKESEKAWDRIKIACEVVLKELNNK